MSTRYRNEPGNRFLEPVVHEALKNPIAGLYFPPSSIPSDRINWLEDSVMLEAVSGAPWGVLGYAQTTANQTGITTETDLTNLSVTVTVGTDRLIKISGFGIISRSVADGVTIGDIQQDMVTVGRWAQHSPSATTEFMAAHGSMLLSPSAGEHTYNLALERFSGTGTVSLNADATSAAFILVEDLGPDPGEQ